MYNTKIHFKYKVDVTVCTKMATLNMRTYFFTLPFVKITGIAEYTLSHV
jgi:hypothetical protein